MKRSGKIFSLILLIVVLIGIGLFIQTGTKIPEKLFKATVNKMYNEIGTEPGKEVPVGHFTTKLHYIVDNYPESIWADDAQWLLAILYMGADSRKAINEYQKIIEKFPNAEWGEWTLKNSPVIFISKQASAATVAQEHIAHIYCHDLKDYKKAIEKSQKLIDAFPDVKPNKGAFTYVVMSCHIIAKSYKELGNIKKAEETYQTIIDRFPDTKVAEIAQEKIEELKSKGK